MAPKLGYAGEVWEGNAKLVKQLETVQMAAAEQTLGCPSTTSNAAVRAEVGIYPPKRKKRREKVEMAIYSQVYPRKEIASHS